MKILPYVGGALIGLMLLFALYVRSLPPPAPKVAPQPKSKMESKVDINTGMDAENIGERKTVEVNAKDGVLADEDDDLEETRGDL